MTSFNLSVTEKELDVLVQELAALEEACQMCEEEGNPREDAHQISNMLKKARNLKGLPARQISKKRATDNSYFIRLFKGKR